MKNIFKKLERVILWLTVIGTAVWQAIEYILQHKPE